MQEIETVESRWLTYEGASRLTSLGRTTIYRIVKSGEVRSTQIGRSVRIDRRVLRATWSGEQREVATMSDSKFEALERRVRELEAKDPATQAKSQVAGQLAETERKRDELAANLARTQEHLDQLQTEEISAIRREAEEASEAFEKARRRRDETQDRHGRLLYDAEQLRSSAKDLRGQLAALGESVRVLQACPGAGASPVGSLQMIGRTDVEGGISDGS